MEDFEKQLRKYKREIAQLEKDNTTLAKKAEARVQQKNSKLSTIRGDGNDEKENQGLPDVA